MRSFAFSKLAIVLFLLSASVASSAHAVDFVVYTDEAAFLAAVTNVGTDTFEDLTPLNIFPTPLNRAAGSYTYTATSLNGFSSASNNSHTNVLLMGVDQTNPIDFTPTGSQPTAMGGYFYGLGFSGDGIIGSGSVDVSINGGQFLLTNTSSTSFFLGWVSTNGTPITSFRISPSGGIPGVDNLTLAQALPVPEPSTYALGTLAALSLGLLSRRKKS